MGSYFLDVALSKRCKQQSSRSRRGEKRSRVTRRATRRATLSVTRSKGGGGGVMSQHDSPPARSPLRRFMYVGPTGSCKWDYVVVSM